jgi:hypothetical protein
MSIKEKQTLIDLTDLTASSYIYWFTDGRQLQKPEVYIYTGSMQYALFEEDLLIHFERVKIGALIQDTRLEMGMTQEQLAKNE